MRVTLPSGAGADPTVTSEGVMKHVRRVMRYRAWLDDGRRMDDLVQIVAGSRKSKPCEKASNAMERVSAAASNPFILGAPDVGVVAPPPPDDPVSRQLLFRDKVGSLTENSGGLPRTHADTSFALCGLWHHILRVFGWQVGGTWDRSGYHLRNDPSPCRNRERFACETRG
jgi:hypothetical protein